MEEAEGKEVPSPPKPSSSPVASEGKPVSVIEGAASIDVVESDALGRVDMR